MLSRTDLRMFMWPCGQVCAVKDDCELFPALYFNLLHTKMTARLNNSGVKSILFVALLTSTSTIAKDFSRVRGEHPSHIGCRSVNQANVSVDSNNVFPTLEFRASWTYKKSFWTDDFEAKYNQQRKENPKHSLKVIVVPHSHNDPGWLRTFDGYFQSHTKSILDNAVKKLVEHPHMRFIWSEISFLHKWWEGATPYQRAVLRMLVQQGRLEIVTGGWVMADEATVNLYSMVDQLIEGHQWVKRHLGVEPKVSWSVDPFGHSAAMPFIFKRAGMHAMVIQRVHYAWKKWLAAQQAGDFEWVQRWDHSRENSIVCHNMPFDIYSIQHSCGPNTTMCKNFDFRDIPGEYRDLWSTSVPIYPHNVKEKAEQLLEQYRKTASLLPHNVALIALGNDFRFEHALEWDQQYMNYKKLFDFINGNWETYRAEVYFGTVSDYFQATWERGGELPTFSGDFFPYSDIFSTGWPGYWTGFYSTRAYLKGLYRRAENDLRSAEFLFTLAFNRARQKATQGQVEEFSGLYSKLVTARRHLALFAHHDATTGTSKAGTMTDYESKLLEAINNCHAIQTTAVAYLARAPARSLSYSDSTELLHLTRRKAMNIVIFNSLPWKRSQYIRLAINFPNVKVIGPAGLELIAQVNPILVPFNGSVHIPAGKFELTFIATLPPLSLSKFQIRRAKETEPSLAHRADVICVSNCNISGIGSSFTRDHGVDVSIQNDKVELKFNRTTGLLSHVRALFLNATVNLNQEFGAYASYWGGSGAYLFKPNLHSDYKPKVPFDGLRPVILKVVGPVTSEIATFHSPLAVRIRIAQRGSASIREVVYLDNTVDLGQYNAEVYMRFNTDLDSTTATAQGSTPTFFTDQNGLSIEKRTKVAQIGLEGNYYPVNTMAFIQDDTKKKRFSVLVDRAHGFSSFENGRLETLIERRTQYDDARGMQEGVTDNRPTSFKYVLLVENIVTSDSNAMLPTLRAYRRAQELSYPPSVFTYAQPRRGRAKPRPSMSFISKSAPHDANILNLRTMSTADDEPSNQAMLILQKLAFNCAGAARQRTPGTFFYEGMHFNGLQVQRLNGADLTGLKTDGYKFNNLSSIAATPFDLTTILVTFA